MITASMARYMGLPTQFEALLDPMVIIGVAFVLLLAGVEIYQLRRKVANLRNLAAAENRRADLASREADALRDRARIARDAALNLAATLDGDPH